MALIRHDALINFLLALLFLKISYPPVRRDTSVVDDYFGTQIADPYRWLEDSESDETKHFVKQQQKLTESFLKGVPSRNIIRQRLKSVWNYERSTAPTKVCGKFYTFENTGLQNQSVIYVRSSLTEENGTIFLDPNTLSEDSSVSLDMDYYSFSKNGMYFTYATSQSGSDWKTVRFMNVSNGRQLPELLEYTKWPSMTWSYDSRGVFYVRYPTPDLKSELTRTAENPQVYYHEIGWEQSNDILIAEFPDYPKRFLQVALSDDGDYLIISGQDNYGANTVHIINLKRGINPFLKDKIIPVFPHGSDAIYTYATNEGSTFIFLTTKDAPNFKLITVAVDTEISLMDNDISSNEIWGEASHFVLQSTFLEEHASNVITWVSALSTDKYLVCYVEDVKNTLELRSLRDSRLLHKFDLPAGSISQFSRESKEESEFFFRLESFTSPGTIYHCQIGGSEEGVKCTVHKQIKVGDIDFKKFITEQVFYPSKDGTLIPMYIVRKNSVKLDGTAPVQLYAYGGYGVSILPTFSTSNLVFVDNFDGIYVLANIRGGGEYGEKWHAGGSLFNKQNVFDDFQAAADYLIKNNYTQPSKLAIRGGSNGGLLIGACVNQRPDLFGAAIAQVGVMDMLRFQKFTAGYAWCSEFGCSDNRTHFENIIKYSPLHNIRMPKNKNVTYPAVLVTTADHDDRVVPAHSFKYTAELQHTIGRDSRQISPLLLRVDAKAGHGAGKPVLKLMEEMTDIYTFLAGTLELKFTWNSTVIEVPPPQRQFITN